MSFDQMQLGAPILKAVQMAGYKKPTPIQEKAIPIILSGQDVMASAQTGTGKTAAFVLPALQQLTHTTSTKPRILILTPTRELATQVTKAANQYGKFLKFNIISLLGGMSYKQQLRDLAGQVDIIVATPGRLLDHMQNKRVDLSHVEMFILDEADRMLDMGFIDDVKDIAKSLPKKRQTLLFSATLDEKLLQAIRHMLKEPVRIDFSEDMLAPTSIKQEIYFADDHNHKKRLLEHFLANENIFKAIIFSATKINADRVAKDLRDSGYAALALHGDLKQNVRNKTVQRLRGGKTQFLVATDVAARGIDINDLTHVINYDLPRFSEDYVHRIGRTGRAGKEGIAISFVLPSDVIHLRRIEKYIGEKIEIKQVEGLEPHKKFHDKAEAPKRRQRFGKKDSERSPNSSGYAKRKAGHFKKDGKKSFSDKKDYSGSGSKFKRSDSKKDSSDRSPRQEGGRKFSRENFKSDRSAKPEFSRGERDTRRNSREDSAPRRASRQDYAGKPTDGNKRREYSSEGRSDSSRRSSRDYSSEGRSDSSRRSSRDYSSEGRSDTSRRSSRDYSSEGRTDNNRRTSGGNSSENRGDTRRQPSRDGYAGRTDSPRRPSRDGFEARSESRGRPSRDSSEGRTDNRRRPTRDAAEGRTDSRRRTSSEYAPKRAASKDGRHEKPTRPFKQTGFKKEGFKKDGFKKDGFKKPFKKSESTNRRKKTFD